MRYPAQFLWVEGRLSAIERLCLKSFIDHGETVHLYHYGPLEDVPSGVVLKDGREVLDENRLRLAESPSGQSYALFSDEFRINLLLKKGGWWFDADVVCLRPLPQPDDVYMASTWEGEFGECALSAILYSPPGSAHLQALHEACYARLAESERFGVIGPFLFQSYVREHQLQDLVAPWHAFCPYPWRHIYRLNIRSSRDWFIDRLRFIKHLWWQASRPDFYAGYLRRNSYGFHLHNEIWKSSGMDKNGRYHPLSLIEQLKRRHGITT